MMIGVVCLWNAFLFILGLIKPCVRCYTGICPDLVLLQTCIGGIGILLLCMQLAIYILFNII